MDKNEFEGKWRRIRPRSKLWWSLITEADLNRVDQAEIKHSEFVTRLQLRYELDHQTARDMIDRQVTEYEASLEASTKPRFDK